MVHRVAKSWIPWGPGGGTHKEDSRVWSWADRQGNGPAETETWKRTGAPGRPWASPVPSSCEWSRRGQGCWASQGDSRARGWWQGRGAFPQACPAPEHRELLPQHPGALLFAGNLLTGPTSLAHSFPGSSQGFRRWWGAPVPGSRRSGWGVPAPFLRWCWVALDCPDSITQPQFSPLQTGNTDPWGMRPAPRVGGCWGVTSPWVSSAHSGIPLTPTAS